MSQPRLTNYWDYIKVEELLALQGGLEADDRELANDEVVFIVVHQVYELWFKLILRELGTARDLFCGETVHEVELSGAVRSLGRIAAVLRLAVQHFEVMETLTTREYLGFRDKLMGASGFQSAQLRQIEILMGLDDGSRIPLGIEGDYKDALRAIDGSDSSARKRVDAQLTDQPTLKAAIEEWLYRTPIDGCEHDAPDAARRLDDFVERFLAAHAGFVDRALSRALPATSGDADRERVRARYAAEKDSVRAYLTPGEADGDVRTRRIRAAMVFIETYRELPLLAWPREVLDGLVEVEQLFVVWRQRHARMVERVIGRRTGTGGSAGVDYLDQTALRYRVFRDLWAVRTLQIPRDAAPELANADFYDFRNAR
ncbi:MAG TPA: tryptophan 2,3-dioxygenase family protein [Planctomycetota bacterium]|nr:tryptophan 2,3-dioxygenase family protein [Planctomycetota bacterium]